MFFFRLIRFVNLCIIVLAMLGAILYLYYVSPVKYHTFSIVNFALLVISTILIAAAGNIINDYFDVKADRINKPDRLIITNQIKKRWAIILHWTFNIIGFLIGMYLSIYYDTFSFVFVHLMSINLLWFYNLYFKKRKIIGNLVISLLTSMIPVLSALFYYFSDNEPFEYSNYIFIYLMASFAFVHNFAREIVKDIHDIEGDKTMKIKSLPMMIGVKKSLFISAVLLFILPVFLTVFWVLGLQQITCFHIAGLINLLTILLIIFKSDKIKLVDNLIKLSMLVGILMFYQLAFL